MKNIQEDLGNSGLIKTLPSLQGFASLHLPEKQTFTKRQTLDHIQCPGE